MSLVSDQRNKSGPLSVMSSNLQNWLDINRSNPFCCILIVIPYVYLITLSTFYHFYMCSHFWWVVCVAYCSFSGLISYTLLPSLTELLSGLLPTVNTLKSLLCQLLWCCESMVEHRWTWFIFQTIYSFVFELDYECCSHSYALPWANLKEGRTDDPRHNCNRDSIWLGSLFYRVAAMNSSLGLDVV